MATNQTDQNSFFKIKPRSSAHVIDGSVFNNLATGAPLPLILPSPSRNVQSSTTILTPGDKLAIDTTETLAFIIKEQTPPTHVLNMGEPSTTERDGHPGLSGVPAIRSAVAKKIRTITDQLHLPFVGQFLSMLSNHIGPSNPDLPALLTHFITTAHHESGLIWNIPNKPVISKTGALSSSTALGFLQMIKATRDEAQKFADGLRLPKVKTGNPTADVLLRQHLAYFIMWYNRALKLWAWSDKSHRWIYKQRLVPGSLAAYLTEQCKEQLAKKGPGLQSILVALGANGFYSMDKAAKAYPDRYKTDAFLFKVLESDDEFQRLLRSKAKATVKMEPSIPGSLNAPYLQLDFLNQKLF